MMTETIRILMAEDDAQDQFLVKKAFRRSRCINSIDIVEDGEELLAYLRREGKFARARRPDLVLLDLNMPGKDGREALAEMKADPALKSIPVVVLTTSGEDEDICRSYDLGVNSYVQKPVTFDKLAEVIAVLGQYWSAVVKLPNNHT